MNTRQPIVHEKSFRSRRADLAPVLVRPLLALAAICGVFDAIGCMSPGSEAPAEVAVDVARAALIGGFPADSVEFNAIGAVTTQKLSFPGARYEPICTATLIEPDVVVTAKHCTRGKSPLRFAIGPDGNAPLRAVDVVAIERAPDQEHDFPDGLGNDVAVLHLAEPITDVEPLAWTLLADPDVGTEFTSIGYGIQDTAGTLGTRKMGHAPLRARSGRGLERVFGSFDAFYAWYLDSLARRGTTCREVEAQEGVEPDSAEADGSATSKARDDGQCSAEYLQAMRSMYEGFLLEHAGQVLVGGAKDGGQACFGDSGGPLLRSSAGGALQVYGVVSWGMGSAELPCDYGTFYTSFDAPKSELLRAAPDWVDPCGTTRVDGVCDGAVATRCTTLAEGSRRLVSLDCAESNLDCQVRADGRVGCGEAGPVPEAPKAEAGEVRGPVFGAPHE